MSSIEIRFNGGKESQTIFIPASTGKKRIHLVFTKAQKAPMPGDKVAENLETVIIGETIWYNCKLCDKKFPKEYSCKNHIRVFHLKPKTLLCNFCGKAFSQKSAYEKHMSDHIRRPYQCDVCRRRFDKDEKLRIHYRGQHEGRIRRYQCGNCQRMFLTLQHLKQHVLTHSDEKPFKCDICMKTFLYNESLKNHLQIHKRQMEICEVCQKEFRTKHLLSVHMVKKHGNKSSASSSNTLDDSMSSSKGGDEGSNDNIAEKQEAVEVNIDNTMATQVVGEANNDNTTTIQVLAEANKDNMTANQVVDNTIADQEVAEATNASVTSIKRDEEVNIGNVTCSIEVETSTTRRGIDQVNTSNTVDNSDFEGSESGAKKSKPEVLFRERQTEFICYVCGKVLTRKAALHEHLKVHTGEKPFACEVCNKRFRQQAHLYRHSKIHTGEKPNECTFCGKRFGRKEHLRQHLTTHLPPDQKVLNYCDTCGKSVVNLKKHIATHKPYKCQECGAGFSDERIFKAHVVDGRHCKENELSKICPICHQTFAKSANVRRHLAKVHKQGDQDAKVRKSFYGKCSVCSKTFRNQAAFQKHIVQGHGLLGHVKKGVSVKEEPVSDSSGDDDNSDEDEDDGFDVLDLI